MALNGRAISLEGTRFVVATSAPGSISPEVSVTPMAPADGSVVYVDGNSSVDLAQANPTGALVLGLLRGDTVQVTGTGEVVMDPGLTVNPGDPLYVSPTNAGNATNVEPTSSGEVIAPIGQVLDILAYSGMMGQTVLMLLDPQPTIEIV